MTGPSTPLPVIPPPVASSAIVGHPNHTRERLAQLWARVPSHVRWVLAALLPPVGCELVFGWHRTAADLPVGIPLGNLIQGGIAGLLYAFIAFGLILVYRANRIINFAQAALGTLPALLGILSVAFAGVPYLLGLLISIVSAVVLGAFVERIVLNPFRSRSRLILTVATIGVGQFIGIGELELPRAFGKSGVSLPATHTPFDGLHVTITKVILNGNYLAVIIVAGAALVGLAAFFRFTRIGLAVRVSSENADRAKLLGIPVNRVNTGVWVLATLLSAFAAFLRQPLAGSTLGADTNVTVLLFGLSAAVIARFDSLPVATLAGIGMGMLDVSAYYGTGNPSISLAFVLPVLLVALLARKGASSRALDTGMSSFRSSSDARPVPLVLARLPEVVWARRGTRAAAVGVLVLLPLALRGPDVNRMSGVLITAIVAVSLVLLTGWAGQVSLGQFGFAGVGAVVAGGLAANHHVDFFLTLIAAVAAGALVAVAVGIPALRVPGLFLAVVTLAFAAVVERYVLSDRRYIPWLVPKDQASISRPYLFGRIDVTGSTGFYYVVVVALVGVLATMSSIRRTRSGRVVLGQRDNIRAAQSYGIDATRTKIIAFAISGAIAALGGALAGYQIGVATSNTFATQLSIDVFVAAIVGGISSPTGAVVGAIIYGTLKSFGISLFSFLGDLGLGALQQNIASIAVAAGVLLVLGFFPGGIAAAGTGIRDRYLRLVAQRRGLVVPSLMADAKTDDSGAAAVRSGHLDQPPADAVLVATGLDVGYDVVQILFDVDMHVRKGEVLALLGTNGAGKSTLLKAISGLLTPKKGTITFNGRDITKLEAVSRVALGIVQVPGGKGVFPTVTVADHFRAARWLVTDAGKADAAQAQVLAWFPRLQERWDQMAGNMSGGEQQQLAVGMAFILEPELLIIDELSLGLAPIVVEQLLEVVRTINARGTAIILVEQSVNVALTVADRAYFLEKGEVRFEGPTAELLERGDIVRSVFLEGGGSDTPAPPVHHHPLPDGTTDPTIDEAPMARPIVVATPAVPLLERPVVLSVRDLSVRFGGVRAVNHVNFDLHAGEILGFIGPNGAGKTTIFDLVSGFVTPTTGSVHLHPGTAAGQGDLTDVTDLCPHGRARLGLGRSFQDARIFAGMTVAENIATALERHLALRDHFAAAIGLPEVWAQEDDIAWTVNDVVDLLHLGAFRDKFVADLSTGSRRVVDLAMSLAFEPSVLLLDEPSSGIAQAETEALAPLLLRIREQTSCAMLIVEHDMPMITKVSDRLVALELGAVVTIGTPDEVISNPQVIASYLGGDAATINRSNVPTAVQTLPDELVKPDDRPRPRPMAGVR